MKQVDNPESWPDPGEGEGYYWIKITYPEAGGIQQWTVGYWRSEEWWETIGDNDLDWKRIVEIGNFIPLPD